MLGRLLHRLGCIAMTVSDWHALAIDQHAVRLDDIEDDVNDVVPRESLHAEERPSPPIVASHRGPGAEIVQARSPSTISAYAAIYETEHANEAEDAT